MESKELNDRIDFINEKRNMATIAARSLYIAEFISDRAFKALVGRINKYYDKQIAQSKKMAQKPPKRKWNASDYLPAGHPGI